MSTTLSMYLGILFVVLGVAAVVIQAILWNPDKYWDAENKRTRAPKSWLRVHRYIGYAFAIIYLLMMWHMIPRLWEYQIELPARTVMHAVAAIVLGVLLITKIAILKFFRYFEEAMPQLGLGILICTIVIGVLSIPYAAQVHDFSGQRLSPDKLEHVKDVLARVDMGPDAPPVESLVTPEALGRGRSVLVEKCRTCHDMRTILVQPRTGSGWFRVSERMAEKPTVFGETVTFEDVPYVTAYMVAITPEIQKSTKGQRRREEKREQAQDAALAAVKAAVATPADDASEPAAVGEAGTPAPTAGDTGPRTPAANVDATPGQTPAPAPAQGQATGATAPSGAAAKALDAAKLPPIDPAKGDALLDRLCTDCHELTDVVDHGGDTAKGWAQVIQDMIDEGAELSAEEAALVTRFLAQKYPA